MIFPGKDCYNADGSVVKVQHKVKTVRTVRIPKVKCSYADKYNAMRPPKCGCSVCWDKWLDRNITQHGPKITGNFNVVVSVSQFPNYNGKGLQIKSKSV